jgi:hypothetical protein
MERVTVGTDAGVALTAVRPRYMLASMRKRRVLVVAVAVLTATLLCGAVLGQRAVASRDDASASPYDGLVVRVRGVAANATSNGWNPDVLCSGGTGNGLPMKSMSSDFATVVQTGPNGLRPISGNVRVTYNNGNIVEVDGSLSINQNGVELIGFNLPNDFLKPNCGSYGPVGSSSAGLLYPVSWWEQLRTGPNSSSDGYTGDGCVAIGSGSGGSDLVATFEVGGCDPSVIPAAPAIATIAMRTDMLKGLLVQFSSPQGAYTFRNDCGPMYFLERGAAVRVIRPATSGVRVALGGQMNLIPLIVTSAGRAHGWAGSATIGLSRSDQTDPAATTLYLTDQNSSKTGRGCLPAPVNPPELGPLPAYVWSGKNRSTYIGRAWIKILSLKGEGAESNTGGGWDALVSFGTNNFSP